jgi:FkbM family methyltransferase
MSLLRRALKKTVRAGLAPLGLQLAPFAADLPEFQPIKIFDLCAGDLIQTVPSPRVLQIGANDGIRFDPLRSFVERHSWPCLMIEPNPVVYAELVKNYANFPSVKTENIAIGETDGTLPLYLPNAELIAAKPDLSGLCSASLATLLSTMRWYHIKNAVDKIDRISVPSLTVPSLLKRHGIDRIDLLQIDTEGYDWKILSQFDLNRLGVRLINIEFKHLPDNEKADCIEFLNRHCFRLSLYDHEGDLVAYRNRI